MTSQKWKICQWDWFGIQFNSIQFILSSLQDLNTIYHRSCRQHHRIVRYGITMWTKEEEIEVVWCDVMWEALMRCDHLTCNSCGHYSWHSFVLPGSQLKSSLSTDVRVVRPHEQSGPFEGEGRVVRHAWWNGSGGKEGRKVCVCVVCVCVWRRKQSEQSISNKSKSLLKISITQWKESYIKCCQDKIR